MEKRIGNYEIIREIGRGGMGVVYLAKDPALGIDIALKALYPDPGRSIDDPEMFDAKERFKKEARLTARLRHLHIVSVKDFGMDEESGILYLVMDYLDGGSLRDAIREEVRFTFKKTLKMVEPIAEALEYIHSQGIVHKDITPGNIMFLGGRPVITDFGIARDVINTRDTETGKLIGSFQYMSPERVREDPFDRRTDIFAFGVIIYEMLTGKNPFSAKDIPAIINKLTNVEPEYLAAACPECPPDFAHLVHMMIQKDPHKRLQSLKSIIEFEPAIPKQPEPAVSETEQQVNPVTTQPVDESFSRIPVRVIQKDEEKAPRTFQPAKKKSFPEWVFALLALAYLLTIYIILSDYDRESPTWLIWSTIIVVVLAIRVRWVGAAGSMAASVGNEPKPKGCMGMLLLSAKKWLAAYLTVTGLYIWSIVAMFTGGHYFTEVLLAAGIVTGLYVIVLKAFTDLFENSHYG